MDAKPKDQPQSRREMYRERGLTLGLPELHPEEYLVQFFYEIGPTRPAVGGGIGPTDWPILHPFGEVVGLDSEDVVLLSRMCKEYYMAWQAGQNPLSIAPVERKRE